MSELNEKINNLNLVSLRKYACAKVSGEKEWFMKCVDCGNCSVGKRVLEIMEGETSPSQDLVSTSVDARIEEALAHTNPAHWLVDEGYYSTIESAKAQIRKYHNRHNNGANLGVSPQSAATIRKARENIVAIFEKSSTLDEAITNFFRREKPNTKAYSVFTKAYRWCRLYPDLVEKYPLMRDLAKYLNEKSDSMAGKTVGDVISELNLQEDEVSVEDFLSETEADIPEEPVKEVPKPATDETQAHVDPSASQELLRYEFGKKRLEFLGRLKKLEEAKKLIDEEAEDLKRQIGLLDQTAEMFGMKAVRSIDCKTA